MDIWMTWCQRRATCAYCKEPIITATRMITGKLWRKGDENSRGMNLRFYWHPNCWVTVGNNWLDLHPYIPHGNRGGRKKLELTPEQARERYLLLRKFAALGQRKRKLRAKYPDSALYQAKIQTRVNELVEQIKLVGGIPKTWGI